MSSELEKGPVYHLRLKSTMSSAVRQAHRLSASIVPLHSYSWSWKSLSQYRIIAFVFTVVLGVRVVGFHIYTHNSADE